MDDLGRRRRARCGLSIRVALLVLGAGGLESLAEEPCAAWPGEPTPLPRVSDSDPVLARWAELRTAELTHYAALTEATDRPESHRLWRRVLCLDPESKAAREGLARSHPVRVHRPAILAEPPATPAEALDPWRELGAPLVVTGEAP